MTFMMMFMMMLVVVFMMVLMRATLLVMMVMMMFVCHNFTLFTFSGCKVTTHAAQLGCKVHFPMFFLPFMESPQRWQASV